MGEFWIRSDLKILCGYNWLHHLHFRCISVAELVVWRVPAPVRGSQHAFRYRLALVVDGECVLRYDNEPGKGDHRHVGKREFEYRFKNAGGLLTDFWADVEEMLK